jgi:hypothetical protein
MESFQDKTLDGIPISHHQILDEGDVTNAEHQQFMAEIAEPTRLPRGFCFPIKSYVDPIGVEYKFDPARYSYDDNLNKLWRNKWRKRLKPKPLKGFTIMSQNRGAVKIDLTKLKQQLGICNWWV